MYGQSIIKAVGTALKIPAENLPAYPRKKAPSVKPDVGKRVKALRDWRDNQANRLNMDPALLFTNSLIRTIAVKNPGSFKALLKIKEMKSWQKHEFGNDIVKILNRVNRK
jgi:ribonuclease D